MADDFSVIFWGVRGTVPKASPAHMGYGGNTSCVEMKCGGRSLVFDAGTGIYPMGESLERKDVDIFLSHTHIDHIMGLPFFSPAFQPDITLRLWAGHLLPDITLRQTLDRLVSPPIFPLTFDQMRSTKEFHDFMAGEEIDAPHLAAEGIRIQTFELHHPDRATAYRVTYAGRSVCYVTDVEHRDDASDEALKAFIEGADVLIYDSTFDERNFERYRGWGHSTWQHAVRLGEAASIGHTVLFHHDPGMDDAALDKRGEEAHAMSSRVSLAREGRVMHL